MKRKSKKLFKRKLENIHSNLMEAHRDSEGFSPNIVGAEREAVHKELLSLILPLGHRIGSGMIVDARGNETGQVDTVIEDAFSLSFPVVTDRNRLYLADTVSAAFEIKSDLSKQGDMALEQCSKIRHLQRTIEQDLHKEFAHIPTFIISFKGPKFTEALEHKYLNARSMSHPNGVLILDQEYFLGRVPGRLNRIYSGTGKAQSILAFLCCLSDTLKLSNNRKWELSSFIELIQ
ncbi:DUF6602 domain-containing protein [Rhizobium ruizarguesonis]|uniref:DUF6602 domain-containing protein n=1 Tax=Rhizobium ruizarguesonis TaxID=2081791 RepID=UPI00102FB809|nr:DUF6602 domain-containing protein [Rhizobium ruizarguesonis]TBD80695.1 hypothetical protein ELH11_12710 [Rhizobium ruizarguesonis]TBE11856.1 hypothetical protein ELH09_12785 [Rhizobium ruizarguesonis]TBE23739.1 hypothetical protein ELH08_13015 [Rhizobium ruizarguesonis]TBE33580.1 hypothetical protein ELH07_13485 [Rhizobium ruizarguesonis]WSG99928.1 DUF6602 domain-containing protein [Rhizobium ruizarguesonis]